MGRDPYRPPILSETPDLNRDMQIRLAAFDHVARLGGEERIVRWTDLQRGFPFEGETIHLVDPSGIFRPRQLSESGAALSMRTSPPSLRYEPKYDDQLSADNDFVHYRYRQGGPEQAAILFPFSIGIDSTARIRWFGV